MNLHLDTDVLSNIHQNMNMNYKLYFPVDYLFYSCLMITILSVLILHLDQNDVMPQEISIVIITI